MLIKVNETTWIRADEVNQIYIARANILGDCKAHFSVNVKSATEDHSKLFDTLEEAEQFAARLANIINFEEAKSS